MRHSTLVVLFLITSVPAFAQRLPGGVTPTHYDLWFAPDLEKATFRGRESITVNVERPSTTVTLNAAEIAFGEVTIEDAAGSQPAKVSLDDKAETAAFTVARALSRGKATITIAYTGILNDKLRGFYLSEANGRKYAVSQMEATDARRAFPSFDEPSYKATFAIALLIDNGDTAISNGRQLSDTPGPDSGKHTVVFAPTPKMSTYLVALLVGDFVCRSGAAGATPIRICSTPDKLPLTAFALSAAQQQVAFFNDYFGIPYPYEKLDIIGIPDFAAGAMENAGAITFRERLLLADEANASVGVRKAVASVISHELAHQWFGNLVTMKWWDDIWLNEGFATWAANKPLAAWKPEWKMDVSAATETQFALGLDSLRSTRAIHTQVSTPAEINEVFDPIAYEKTSGVLNMIEAYVGPESFRRGVSSYLKKYAQGNAAGEDFWLEMTRVTEKPVNRIMKSLVDQAGAPLLSVSSRCVNNTTEVSIKQRRFTGTPEAAKADPLPGRWTLPVCVKTATGESCSLVSEAEQTIRAPGCGAAMVNADARGYYFTEYTPAAVAALATRTPPLTAAERISLLGDEWRMATSGRHDIGTYLELAAAFATDSTPAIISEIATRVGYVLSDIADAAERPAFEAWLRKAFRPALDRIGIDPKPGDSDDVNSVRGTLLRSLSSDPAVQQHARVAGGEVLRGPGVAAAHPRRAGPAGCGCRWRCPALRSIPGPDEGGDRQSGRVLSFLQRAAGILGARVARAHPRVCAHGSAVAGHARAPRPAARVRLVAGGRVGFREIRVAGSLRQGRDVSRCAVHGQRARCVLLGRTWERDQELLRRAPRSGGRARAAAGLRAHRHLRCRRCTAIAGFRQVAEHSDAMRSGTRSRRGITMRRPANSRAPR